MKCTKDYFEGMEHLADAILYELNRLSDYYYYKHADTEEEAAYYATIEKGIDKAMDVVQKILYIQLKVEEEE